MSMFCWWGLHRWQRKKATRRPSRMVKRCGRCGKVSVQTVKTKLLTKAAAEAPEA